MMINILDQSVANRIAAGEVVERPASVVKELLDNAIDAKATKINVEIENGGIDKISVIDNGIGIREDDIVKAFLPHATSKIKTIEDLNNIFTLGFRGEALSSIASVSQSSILSKTKESDYATELCVNGGEFEKPKHSSGINGTRLTVRNLFYNTPARKKFLKKNKYEENEITNVLSRYIMSNPNISFKYIVDGEIVYNTSGDGLLNAICAIYGQEIKDNLLEVNYKNDDYEIKGFVGKIDFTKPNTTYQTLIVNGRYVVEPIVSKAVYSAYEDYLMTRQFPFFVLNINLDYSKIDVNVHPSKINIKFDEPSKVYDVVYECVRKALFKYIESKYEKTQTKVENSIDTVKYENISGKSFGEMVSEVQIESIKEKNNINYDFRQNKNENIFPNNSEVQKNVENVSIFDKKVENYIEFQNFKTIGTAFSEFLILEQGDNLIFIDFHAAHERLNYDKFKNQLEEKNILVQNLLVPFTYTMSANELDFILEMKNRFVELGFEMDQFGKNDIKISSVPLSFKNINLNKFINDLLYDMKNFKPKFDREIDEFIAQRACKSSVKAGQTLNEMEIQSLLSNLDTKKPVLLCPHGRPIIEVIPKSDIEKWFKRIV